MLHLSTISCTENLFKVNVNVVLIPIVNSILEVIHSFVSYMLFIIYNQLVKKLTAANVQLNVYEELVGFCNSACS